ncbi:hypothetical protein ESP131_00005 [Exiguobacterium sp. U13-1]|uniref:glycosyltransferase family 2 protein n=1 Tax=Exiguobacterium sp. U13-1 TaxID=1849031 RepID=UPI000859451C|nr:glycosyltransferase family A protein [Exiguobacterium sp. U13-1]AOT01790.1 hypothetical protein ESP131_00005 [Exiguobacterium sp. U13-1]
MEKKLTIITPTYNRAYILPKLYESLKRQTLLKFEWIIIDDGSIDNTESLVKSWMESVPLMFEINYFKQKNGGKHRALNLGVSKSRYEYIYIIDSDDYMTEDGVQHIYNWISSIGNKFKIIFMISKDLQFILVLLMNRKIKISLNLD